MRAEANRRRRLRVWRQRLRADGGGVRKALPLVVLILALGLGCVTPLPRPGQVTATAEAPNPSAAVPMPTTEATVQVPTAVPTAVAPAPTGVPTATVAPTATLTAVPPTAMPTEVPAPTSAPVGPFLQVYAPEDGATVLGNTVVVYGRTAAGSELTVGESPTEVDSQGGFRSTVSLEPGENVVAVTARGPEAGSTTVRRNVTSLFLPFLLLITEPENESIVFDSMLPISGRTGPNAIVSVNGRSVPVDRFGYFTSSFQLDVGPNVIDVVATNEDGQTLSKVLAVIYRRSSE